MSSASQTTFLVLLALFLPIIHGWGEAGHFVICKIAESRLSTTAKSAVWELIPGGDLASHCSWADYVRFKYHWSFPLHYIDTPDALCSYEHQRDCKDQKGDKDFCVSGAIMNYTNQLLAYRSALSYRRSSMKLESHYNLTEALMFLSHFIGDIHQPLHVGFTSDKGGNTIDVHWYRRKSNLHKVWDEDMVDSEEKQEFFSKLEILRSAIEKNITDAWADEVAAWKWCRSSEITCPDTYAVESVTAACKWAYRGVTEGSTLGDPYFWTRLPVINQRLAQAGVRLAATLNRIFA